MRKIIVISMITLDGVMQAPGGPGEDTSGNFEYGGWVAPFSDADGAPVMNRLMEPADLLLGRKTFEIFAAYWPAHAHAWPGINKVTKYVLSKTLKSSDWENVIFLDSAAAIQQLKETNGGDIKVWGSSKLVQLLLKNDLVDELWLKIHPLVLGKGKKLFGDDINPAAFTLEESVVTAEGVVFAHYKKAGEVKTGTIGN